ncbi:MAG: ATP-binding protein [Phycisphaerae bacterium]|nr:ATP-binding protein [Phycisphaerae bacterium]
MYRAALKELKNWVSRPDHKPLVLRGARQVGKSYLAGMLANEVFEAIAEINFEQNPEIAELFSSRRPEQIIPLLEARLNMSIVPGKTLLFLDEIQAAPYVFAALRYFYEQMPDLHVIAAGSLLEFVLAEHQFSMPVGRIEYLHLGPMTFEEYLLAVNREKLVEFLQGYCLPEPIPDVIHTELMRHVIDYCVVGGMPEAVRTYAESKSYLESERVLSSILSTYRADFNKYGQRVNQQRIEKVFMKIPALVGQKVKYTQIDREEKSRDLKQSLYQLELAKIMYRVIHSDANGVPLGAEVNDKYYKPLLLDVGLLCRSVGLTMSEIQSAENLMMINSGQVCEQFVGQHLLYSGRYYEDPALFCWLRQRGAANAEVDYLLTEGTVIIPVEVKAGKTGSLKSLHVFINEKQRDFALRFYAGHPLLTDAVTSVSGMKPVDYRLLSLPFYLIGQTRRLCREFAVCE